MTIITSGARTTELTAAGQLENPFAAWDNHAARSTSILGGTATLADGGTANAVSGTTYDYWMPNVTATTAQFSVKLPAAAALNCFGIAAHNLGTLGGSVFMQRSTDGGATWSTAGLGGLAPADNSPVMWRVASTGIDSADWRLNFTGLTAGAKLYVGVAFFGTDMIFPRRFYRGFAPPITPSEVQLQSNVSVGGNLLGNSIVAQGTTLTAQFGHLTPAYVRGTLLPFIPYFNAGKGFLFGWRPTTFPQDVRYCWREGGVIRPVNSGPLDFMSIDMAMRAYES